MRNFKVTVDGNTYNVAIEEVSGNEIEEVSIPKAEVKAVPTVSVVAPIATPAPAAKAMPTSGTKVTSPFPGTVLSVIAKNGATVKKGDILFVVEAMKMENDIAAPCGGVITIIASKGEAVNSNDLLATIG